MATVRPPVALDPRFFGKRAVSRVQAMPLQAHSTSDDLRLFGMTFAAGFLFVTVLIA